MPAIPMQMDLFPPLKVVIPHVKVPGIIILYDELRIPFTNPGLRFHNLHELMNANT